MNPVRKRRRIGVSRIVVIPITLTRPRVLMYPPQAQMRIAVRPVCVPGMHLICNRARPIRSTLLTTARLLRRSIYGITRINHRARRTMSYTAYHNACSSTHHHPTHDVTDRNCRRQSNRRNTRKRNDPSRRRRLRRREYSYWGPVSRWFWFWKGLVP